MSAPAQDTIKGRDSPITRASTTSSSTRHRALPNLRPSLRPELRTNLRTNLRPNLRPNLRTKLRTNLLSWPSYSAWAASSPPSRASSTRGPPSSSPVRHLSTCVALAAAPYDTVSPSLPKAHPSPLQAFSVQHIPRQPHPPKPLAYAATAVPNSLPRVTIISRGWTRLRPTSPTGLRSCAAPPARVPVALPRTIYLADSPFIRPRRHRALPPNPHRPLPRRPPYPSKDDTVHDTADLTPSPCQHLPQPPSPRLPHRRPRRLYLPPRPLPPKSSSTPLSPKPAAALPRSITRTSRLGSSAGPPSSCSALPRPSSTASAAP